MSCPATAEIHDSIPCSVTVTVPTGAPTPSGDVTVTPGDETCDISTNPCSLFVPAGSTTGDLAVSATYPGQSGITGSSGNTSVSLTLRATDIAMDCSSPGHADGSAAAGAPITCALTVTDLDDPQDFTPDGTVSAVANGVTQSCTLNPEIKSCSVVFSAGLPSSQAITSSYPGDGTEFLSSNASDQITVA